MSNTASLSATSQAHGALHHSDGRGGRFAGRELNAAAHILPSVHASPPLASQLYTRLKTRLLRCRAAVPDWDSVPSRRDAGTEGFGEAEDIGREGRKLSGARSSRSDRRSPWDDEESGGPSLGPMEQQAAVRERSGGFEGGDQRQGRRGGGRGYGASNFERAPRVEQRSKDDSGPNRGFQDSRRDLRGLQRGDYDDDRYPSRGGGEASTRGGGRFGQRYERNLGYEDSSRGGDYGEGRRGPGRGRGRGGGQRRGYDRRDVLNAEEIGTTKPNVWTRDGGRQYVQR